MTSKFRLLRDHGQVLRREGGAATLIVAIVLLALLTLTVLTVAGLTMLELKTGANTNRAKEAFHVAQGGLDYGAMKYVEDASAWTPSGTTSVAIPASGATEAQVSVVVSGGYATVTATGESPDQTGSATITERYGTVPLLGSGELPPLMANGNIPINGSFSIVTNPNGGGEGVPVSGWAKTADKNGTGSWDTCNLDEFLYAGGNADEKAKEDSDVAEWVCDDCKCSNVPADEKLCDSKAVVDAWECDDIVAEPCAPDTFENLFGVNVATNPCGSDSGVTPSAWQEYRDLGMQYGVTCGDLDEDIGDMFYSGGAHEGEMPLIWIEGNCKLPTRVGKEEAPIILVIHGDVTANANIVMYGILFAFSDIYTATPKEDYGIKLTGTATVYGVVMVNGTAEQVTGTYTLVYSNDLLDKLTNDGEGFDELARFPGSWTDIN
ncbi:PilX N-terminal domain-containing pilus assembly protein [Marinobacterium sp. YM272]|uniref:PilX N-terminal domain-containing pilus assembly protein n=1 Tax=Marinobacterium sp. YM272 TaxID=3421654 RepID=UPI003D7FCF13